MLKESLSGHQWRGPGEHKTIRFSVSSPELVPEEGQALHRKVAGLILVRAHAQIAGFGLSDTGCEQWDHSEYCVENRLE